MTDDLVKRLRHQADEARKNYPEVFRVSEEIAYEAADRIEKLESALEDMAQYISKADWIQLKPETHQVWDLGEIDD